MKKYWKIGLVGLATIALGTAILATNDSSNPTPFDTSARGGKAKAVKKAKFTIQYQYGNKKIKKSTVKWVKKGSKQKVKAPAIRYFHPTKKQATVKLPKYAIMFAYNFQYKRDNYTINVEYKEGSHVLARKVIKKAAGLKYTVKSESFSGYTAKAKNVTFTATKNGMKVTVAYTKNAPKPTNPSTPTPPKTELRKLQEYILNNFFQEVEFHYGKLSFEEKKSIFIASETHQLEDELKTNATVSKRIKEIVSSAGIQNEEKNELEITSKIYQWYKNNVKYDYDYYNGASKGSRDKYGAWEPLFSGKGICGEQSYTMESILNTFGIKIIATTYKNFDGRGGHAAFFARLNGTWWLIDPTFGTWGRNFNSSSWHNEYINPTKLDGIFYTDFDFNNIDDLKIYATIYKEQLESFNSTAFLKLPFDKKYESGRKFIKQLVGGTGEPIFYK